MGLLGKFFIIAVFITALSNCSKKQQNTVPQTTLEHDQKIEILIQRSLEENVIRVVDDMTRPVAQAQIKINGESYTTDDQGVLPVPEKWKDQSDILIQKEGFISAAYLAQKVQGHLFEIHKLPLETQNTVRGTSLGFGPLPNDSFIDFALNTKNFSTKDLLNFDISQIISPVSDDISIMGRTLRIPTNVYLPKQEESYLFFSFTIAKEFFRLFYNDTGTFRIHSNRGKFNFKDVKNKLEAGKSFFEVVNDFQFLSLGEQTVSVVNGETKAEINSSQKTLNDAIDFVATNNTRSSLFGISLFKENEDLHFCDIKLYEANKKQKLSLPKGVTDRYILLVLADKHKTIPTLLDDSISTAITPVNNQNSLALMDRIPTPTLSGTTLHTQLPIIRDTSRAFATTLTLSRRVIKNAAGSSETYIPTLEVYAENWIQDFNYANLANLNNQEPHRWDVSFFAVDSQNEKSFNGPSTLNQATHVVHNALNF